MNINDISIKYPWYIHAKSMNIPWYIHTHFMMILCFNQPFTALQKGLMAWTGQSISFSLQIGSLRCRDIINSTTSIEMYMYLYTIICIYVPIYIHTDQCIDRCTACESTYIFTIVYHIYIYTYSLDIDITELMISTVSVVSAVRASTSSSFGMGPDMELASWHSPENPREIPGRNHGILATCKTYSPNDCPLQPTHSVSISLGWQIFQQTGPRWFNILHHCESQHRTDTLPKTNIAIKNGAFQ